MIGNQSGDFSGLVGRSGSQSAVLMDLNFCQCTHLLQNKIGHPSFFSFLTTSKCSCGSVAVRKLGNQSAFERLKDSIPRNTGILFLVKIITGPRTGNPEIVWTVYFEMIFCNPSC